MLTKILIATDGSDCALKAAQAAAALAKSCTAAVILLTVHTPHTPDAERFPNYVLSSVDLDGWATAKAQEAVLECTGRALTAAGVAYVGRKGFGQPATEIVRIAEEEHVELIVLGSRGLSGLQSLFLGSVSERVVHHAPCSVLVVK